MIIRHEYGIMYDGNIWLTGRHGHEGVMNIYMAMYDRPENVIMNSTDLGR